MEEASEQEEEATEDSEASHAETTDEDTMASSEKEGKVLFVVEGTSTIDKLDQPSIIMICLYKEIEAAQV